MVTRTVPSAVGFISAEPGSGSEKRTTWLGAAVQAEGRGPAG